MTTYKQKFNNLVETAVKSASDRFLEDGHHPLTTWLFEDKNDTRVMLAFAPDIPKPAMLKKMREIAADRDVVRYTVQIEVWVALPSDDTRSPKDRPDRLEALIVYGQDRQNNTASIVIEIERKSDKYFLAEPMHGEFANDELKLF